MQLYAKIVHIKLAGNQIDDVHFVRGGLHHRSTCIMVRDVEQHLSHVISLLATQKLGQPLRRQLCVEIGLGGPCIYGS